MKYENLFLKIGSMLFVIFFIMSILYVVVDIISYIITGETINYISIDILLITMLFSFPFLLVLIKTGELIDKIIKKVRE